MKRLILTTACSIPMALGSLAMAQTTPPPATETPAETAPGSTNGTSATNGTAGTSGTPGTAGTPGSTAAPGTTPTPGTAPTPTPDTGTMGTAPSGAMDTEMSGDATETITGWSIKNSVMGESVYNENDEKVGDVNDVVISPDGNVTHVIVGAGGFLGMGQHDVAIPFEELQRGDDRLTLSGYTKDQLKALPKVELAE